MRVVYEILEKTDEGWRCIAALPDKGKIKERYQLLKKTTLSTLRMVEVFKSEQECSKKDKKQKRHTARTDL